MAELTWKERKQEWTSTVQALLDSVVALIDTVPVTDIRRQYRDAAKPLPERMTQTLDIYQNEVDMAHEMLLYRLRNYREYLRNLVGNKFYGTGEVKSMYTSKTLKYMGINQKRAVRANASESQIIGVFDQSASRMDSRYQAILKTVPSTVVLSLTTLIDYVNETIDAQEVWDQSVTNKDAQGPAKIVLKDLSAEKLKKLLKAAQDLKTAVYHFRSAMDN